MTEVSPFCVHTAWSVQLEPSLRGRAKLFDKKKTALDDLLMEAMFEYLHQEVAQLEATKIKHTHAEVFEFAEQYFDEEDNALLLNLLSAKTSNKREVLLERLAFIRRLEESILHVFSEQSLNIDPMLFGAGNSESRKGVD